MKLNIFSFGLISVYIICFLEILYNKTVKYNKKVRDFYKEKYTIDKCCEFMNKCRKDADDEKVIPKYKIKHPKITVFLPLYNKQEFLRNALRSIQYQSFKDIEILFIDDYSSDNSSIIVTDYQKKDRRIRLIKNPENRGAQLSRAIAIKNSKGKFLLALDPDDMLCNQNILEILYYTAETYGADLIHYARYITSSKKVENDKGKVEIIRNPGTNYFFDEKGKLTNSSWSVWDKFASKRLYRKVYNKIIKDIVSFKCNYYSDVLMTYYLLKYTNTFISCKILGIGYVYNNQSVWGKKLQMKKL